MQDTHTVMSLRNDNSFLIFNIFHKRIYPCTCSTCACYDFIMNMENPFQANSISGFWNPQLLLLKTINSISTWGTCIKILYFSHADSFASAVFHPNTFTSRTRYILILPIYENIYISGAFGYSALERFY